VSDVRIVITSPLSAENVAAIAAADPRLDVVYPADLIPAPEYPSAHGCVTSAYAHTIAEFFGTKRLPGGITLTGAAGHPDRHFDSTDDIIKEIIDARVYNGVHYRTSVVEGTILGRKVAKWVAKFNFKPSDAHVPQGPKRE